jgi:hypothetical protein
VETRPQPGPHPSRKQAASDNVKQPISIGKGPGQAARMNAAMGCEGNETFSNGSSEPHMRRVNESLSVCTCTVHSDGTYGISHVSRSEKGQGDNKEQRDEVMAVSISPEHSGKLGHDMSGGGPERNEVE